MFVIILLLILIIIYLFNNIILIKDNFTQYNKYSNSNLNPNPNPNPTQYPYNPQIQTPQSNYSEIISKINSQQKYKSDLSIALAPTPTVNCPKLKNVSECNNNGCNWFGSFCSSTYPTQV